MYQKLIFITSMILLGVSCGGPTQTKTKIVQVPKVETLEVPVTIPGTSTIISVPQLVIVDKGFGIKTLPKPISRASETIQKYGQAVAKILSINGSSGTGFFISEDGLFLTNEHVLPRKACTVNGCPGIKIIRDFKIGGTNQVYTDFEVLAHSSSQGEMDFTLIRVKLPAGEKVPYLNPELDSEKYSFKSADAKTYKVLGHPGGSSLRNTNVLPVNMNKFDIQLLGLIIPGNSGGPLIEEESGNVIGLIKQSRTGYIKEDDESARHDSFARATSLLEIMKAIETSTKPQEKFSKPNKSIFLSALRKDEPGSALEELDKYIGTSSEEGVLKLMFSKSEIVDGALNEEALNQLLMKQILLGRELPLPSELQEVFEGPMTPVKLKLMILNAYFKDPLKQELQKKCRNSFPQTTKSFPAFLLFCSTSHLNTGHSFIPTFVGLLMNSRYETLDDFASVNLNLRLAVLPGLNTEEDKAEYVKLLDFLEDKVKDIGLNVQNDSLITESIYGLRGQGTFKNTFPTLSSETHK
jgi:hypothetical protein